MPRSNPLPNIIQQKIYKTGQTRGAEDDVIFQNRVGRNSTVLIPFHEFELCRIAPTNDGIYEKGFIVLIKPEDYFAPANEEKIRELGLTLGENLLVFYETRKQWQDYPPREEWTIPDSRSNPLGGQYVARIPATTAEGEAKIIRGYDVTALKGAGIRVYEYADSSITNQCRLQLEYEFWKCADIEDFIARSADAAALRARKSDIENKAIEQGLADTNHLIRARILDRAGYTICPLCLKRISALGFGDKIQQAEGRDVPDLTVTEVSLFHIRELRTGEFNHKPYNLGWGHHHCNVVVKDSGIHETLEWMKEVIRDNDQYELDNR